MKKDHPCLNSLIDGECKCDYCTKDWEILTAKDFEHIWKISNKKDKSK